MFDYLSIEARGAEVLRDLRAEADRARLARHGAVRTKNTPRRIVGKWRVQVTPIMRALTTLVPEAR